MDPAEAKRLLMLHSGRDPEINHPKWASGFLGSLRPYKGHLVEANFHEVMAALRALAPSLEAGPQVDRDVVASLWGICHLGRAWGVEPDGMLRRNGLIAEQDVRTLDNWVARISYATLILLDGGGVDAAFDGYDHWDDFEEGSPT